MPKKIPFTENLPRIVLIVINHIESNLALSYYDGRYNNLHVTIQIRVIIVDITTVIGSI